MFEAYMMTLRESFKKDLSSLLSNLPKIIEINKEFFDDNPLLEAQLKSALYIAQSFKNKMHPGNIIEDYPVEYWTDTDKDYSAVFETFKLISTSLKSVTGDDSYWAKQNDLKKLYTDSDILKLYLGLLEHKAAQKEITFGTGSTLAELIDASYKELAVNLPVYKSYIRNISYKIGTLNGTLENLSEIKNDSLMLEKYYGLITASIDLMKDATKINSLPHISINIDTEKFDHYFDLVQAAADLAIDLNRRNYSSAIVNSAYLFDNIFTKEQIGKFITNKHPDLDSVKLKVFIDSAYLKYSGIRTALFKYGTFISAITQAKSSEQVESVIESFALPSGSSTIKRTTSYNVALNSYVGFYAGYEKIRGVTNKADINSTGVIAPIGVAISKGNSFLFTSPDWAKGHSSSLFFSLVDIGAVAAFRFGDDSTGTVPTITLKDIFSPGIFYSWGIAGSPISVNGGFQIGPLLRKVKQDENTYKDYYTRWSISINVDIPVLNFYTNP